MCFWNSDIGVIRQESCVPSTLRAVYSCLVAHARVYSSAHWHFGIVQIVELLLQYGALVDAVDDDHYRHTALHVAALNGRSEVVPVQLHDASQFTEL